MTFNFTPEHQAQDKLNAPYFEDAKATDTPGYTTSISEDRLQQQIADVLVKLGASAPIFIRGTFGEKPRKRYGYQIQFNFAGRPAQVSVAALPIRYETDRKKSQALRHALFTVREMFKSQLAGRIMTPGYEPLAQLLLVPGTGRTVGELILIQEHLPRLNPSLPASVGDVVEGVVVE